MGTVPPTFAKGRCPTGGCHSEMPQGRYHRIYPAYPQVNYPGLGNLTWLMRRKYHCSLLLYLIVEGKPIRRCRTHHLPTLYISESQRLSSCFGGCRRGRSTWNHAAFCLLAAASTGHNVPSSCEKARESQDLFWNMGDNIWKGNLFKSCFIDKKWSSQNIRISFLLIKSRSWLKMLKTLWGIGWNQFMGWSRGFWRIASLGRQSSKRFMYVFLDRPAVEVRKVTGIPLEHLSEDPLYHWSWVQSKSII